MAFSKAIPVAFALAAGCFARSSSVEPLPPAIHAEAASSLVAAAAVPAPPAKVTVEWAEALVSLEITNANTRAEAVIRLYGSDGELDPAAVSAFERVATDGAGPLVPRVMQMAVKAAAHFHVHKLMIVSAFRPMKRGKGGGYHARGEALDFKLVGVDSRKLAAYLRSYAKAGVGIYTNPGTQYVHLDARDQSFHWLDASPPGRTWREAPLADPNREARDAAFTPKSDLPIP